MILKTICNFENKEGSQTEFTDNFDRIEKQTISVADANKEGAYIGMSTSHYYNSEVSNPELHHVVKMMLFKKIEELQRVLLVDDRFEIYLLNDEGKTIERIN